MRQLGWEDQIAEEAMQTLEAPATPPAITGKSSWLRNLPDDELAALKVRVAEAQKTPNAAVAAMWRMCHRLIEREQKRRAKQ